MVKINNKTYVPVTDAEKYGYVRNALYQMYHHERACKRQSDRFVKVDGTLYFYKDIKVSDVENVRLDMKDKVYKAVTISGKMLMEVYQDLSNRLNITSGNLQQYLHRSKFRDRERLKQTQHEINKYLKEIENGKASTGQNP